MTMAKLVFGRLTEAWKGEASDFTPLLAEQLDSLGEAIGVDLTAVGKSEVATTGGRRIDIVAQGEDGSEFVVENQDGRADHDHLTRGLAYAVARHARGLVVVAEEHRDEFRAVAQYPNDLAELDRERGISVWLVEAKAVRISDSPWAPLFSAVVEPNQFTAKVEQAKQAERVSSLDELFTQFASSDMAAAAEAVVERWVAAGYRRRLGPNYVVLEAPGPSAGGIRTVVAIFNDGRVLVPFSAYAGTNSGIPIPALTSSEFRVKADRLFGFNGTEKQARTGPGWLAADRVDDLFAFCFDVASAYKIALEAETNGESTGNV
ncbi:MAG: hypothetical protein NTV28_06720 [Propionibacteriales bacterium]|nr:hypothetical protein [Propionibacteriales bacterium]